MDREEPGLFLSDESALELARTFVDPGTGPSQRLLREELRRRVRAALTRLETQDREILILRHLEQLRVSEIAALLGISEGAVKMRRLRAVQRLRELVEKDHSENPS